MSFNQASVHVTWGHMRYRCNDNEDWTFLEESFKVPGHSLDDLKEEFTVGNINSISFSNQGVAFAQLDKMASKANGRLLEKSLKWIVRFTPATLSSLWATEVHQDRGKKNSLLEIGFESASPPEDWDVIEERDPKAIGTPTRIPRDVAPGGPETFPLAKLTKTYVEMGIRQIRLQFIRGQKTSGPGTWAWPIVVAFLVGAARWDTNMGKNSREALFALDLDTFVLKPNPYAYFTEQVDGHWQIHR